MQWTSLKEKHIFIKGNSTHDPPSISDQLNSKSHIAYFRIKNITNFSSGVFTHMYFFYFSEFFSVKVFKPSSIFELIYINLSWFLRIGLFGVNRKNRIFGRTQENLISTK